MVSTVECALKHVSDWLMKQVKAQKQRGDRSKEEEAVDTYSKDQGGRTLCGVMRIGLGCKRLAD